MGFYGVLLVNKTYLEMGKRILERSFIREMMFTLSLERTGPKSEKHEVY